MLRIRTNRDKWARASAFAALLCVGATALGGPKDRGVGVYWVDVEGGAATLIVTPAGESILIDTGLAGQRDPDRIADIAKRVARIKRIDHLVITHFDIDHHGGAADLADRIPIARVYDPGGKRGRPHASYTKYLAFRKNRPYTVLKPGDQIPLSQAKGGPKLSITCLAAARKFIRPKKKPSPDPAPKAASSDYPVDKSENANSIVLLIKFGSFEFLDSADLTCRLEHKLVSPVNLVGQVDVYQVAHHGLDWSNNPALIKSIKPTVTVMNNSHRKGCQPRTRKALRAVRSIQANYQLHKNLQRNADNTDDALIANHEPTDKCKANHIELHVAADAATYTVKIPAKKHERTFKTK